MENTEKFRGQTNGIILFVLLGGDRHTDELKEIIDEKFSQVKIGTLYSIISRMKTQGHISEYRASSADGSRRKYYKITDLGRNVYENEFSELFNDVEPIIVQETKKVETVNVQEKEPEYVQEDDVYAKYVKKAELLQDDEIEIQFPTKQEVKTEEKPTISVDNSPIFDATEPETVPEKEIDYDSVVSSNYEYRSVLTQLFPKEKPNFDDFDDYSYTNYSNVKTEPEITVPAQPQKDNVNTLFEISEKENIKIRTSVDTNRYQGSKILSNKLRFHSSFITSVFAILEFLLLSFFFSGSVEFNSKSFVTICIIFGIFTAVNLLIYILKHSHTVKDLPKLINSLEIAIVLAIGIIIISICTASIGGLNLYDFNQIYYSIIIPSVMACNIPLFVAITHFLSKLDFYQSI